MDLGLHPAVRADQVVSAYATRQSTGRGSGRRRTPQGSPASEGDDGAGDGDSGAGVEGWTAGGDQVLQSAGGPRGGKKKRPAQGRPSTGATGSGTWDSCSLHCAPTLDVTMRVLFVVVWLLLFVRQAWARWGGPGLHSWASVGVSRVSLGDCTGAPATTAATHAAHGTAAGSRAVRLAPVLSPGHASTAPAVQLPGAGVWLEVRCCCHSHARAPAPSDGCAYRVPASTNISNSTSNNSCWRAFRPCLASCSLFHSPPFPPTLAPRPPELRLSCSRSC